MRWQALVAALLVDTPEAEVIVRRPGDGSIGIAARATTTLEAAAVASGLWPSRTTPGLQGAAASHLTAVVRAAASTLDLLERSGWSALVDRPMGIPASRLGADAVAERTGSFDPLAGTDSPAP